MFKAGVFLEELKLHAPDIYEACLIAFENKKILIWNLFQMSLLTMQLWKNLPSDENHISIDSKNNLIYGNERKIVDALLISKINCKPSMGYLKIVFTKTLS